MRTGSSPSLHGDRASRTRSSILKSAPLCCCSSSRGMSRRTSRIATGLVGGYSGRTGMARPFSLSLPHAIPAATPPSCNPSVAPSTCGSSTTDVSGRPFHIFCCPHGWLCDPSSLTCYYPTTCPVDCGNGYCCPEHNECDNYDLTCCPYLCGNVCCPRSFPFCLDGRRGICSNLP